MPYKLHLDMLNPHAKTSGAPTVTRYVFAVRHIQSQRIVDPIISMYVYLSYDYLTSKSLG
jgi:hypothetical protein